MYKDFTKEVIEDVVGYIKSHSGEDYKTLLEHVRCMCNIDNDAYWKFFLKFFTGGFYSNDEEIRFIGGNSRSYNPMGNCFDWLGCLKACIFNESDYILQECLETDEYDLVRKYNVGVRPVCIVASLTRVLNYMEILVEERARGNSSPVRTYVEGKDFESKADIYKFRSRMKTFINVLNRSKTCLIYATYNDIVFPLNVILDKCNDEEYSILENMEMLGRAYFNNRLDIYSSGELRNYLKGRSCRSLEVELTRYAREVGPIRAKRIVNYLKENGYLDNPLESCEI